MSSTVCRYAWGAFSSKFLVSAAAAALLAACSADADRFTAGSSGADPVQTASVPGGMTAANVGVDDQVTSKPLASATPQQPPAYNYAQPYKAPAYRQPAVPAAPAPQVAASAPGSTVTVGPGMTLYSLARANNLSVAELAAANGIKPPYSVHTGQVLRIPGAGSAPATTASYAEPESAPIAGPPRQVNQQPFKQGPSVSADASGELHTVGNGETLYSLGRKFGVSPFAIADANGLPKDAQLTTGQKVRIPAGGAAAPAARTAAAKTTAPKQAETGDSEAPGTEEVADAAPSAPKALPLPSPTDEAAAPEKSTAGGQQVAEGAPIAGAPGMRWPVRGKIISGFGPKANGLKNEGINIAVPEGTSIRAAADGVVAYAGNELKGYGNLVLIRHEDGYVTAYAHAKELFVKRGDTVKRGDVIAKAGQTGSVSSPQLHFEVRKGAVALDPMKFLSANTASN